MLQLIFVNGLNMWKLRCLKLSFVSFRFVWPTNRVYERMLDFVDLKYAVV